MSLREFRIELQKLTLELEKHELQKNKHGCWLVPDGIVLALSNMARGLRAGCGKNPAGG